MPLAVAIDFNAHFTSCSVWQDHGREQRCISGCFVTEPEPDKDMSQTLAIELLSRIEQHPNKTVYITGDRNGLNASSGSKKNADGTWITLFDEFAQVFEEAGWHVILCPLTYNPFKDDVYLLMKDILNETRDDGLHMRFHPIDAKCVLVSMQRAPMTGNYQKDKRSENKKDEEQQYATHLSDTVDYYAAWRSLGGMGTTNGSSGFDNDFM